MCVLCRVVLRCVCVRVRGVARGGDDTGAVMVLVDSTFLARALARHEEMEEKKYIKKKKEKKQRKKDVGFQSACSSDGRLWCSWRCRVGYGARGWLAASTVTGLTS